MARSAILAAGYVDLTPNGVNYHDGEYLLIEDGRILGFERASHLYSDLEVVDFSSDFCVPGLVDTAFLAPVGVNEDGTRPASYGTGVWHARRLSQKWLDSGVTSAASMGGIDRLDLDLGKSIAEGRLIGPRIYPALSPLVPAGMSNFGALYGVREVSGVDEARRAVRELIKQGAERIVLYADVPLEFHADPHETSRHRLVFSVDELVEMVTQARQAGCYLHAQAISAAAIDNCLQAGVRSIGCAFGLNESHIPIMVARGIALAPNLALGATMAEVGPAWGFSPDSVNMVSKQRIAPALLRQAHEAGVEIICGTNAAFMTGNVLRECTELQRVGLSTLDVLRAATQNGAQTLKPYVESGSFRSHHMADLFFVQQNPIDDLQALSRISAVMVGGTIQRSGLLSAATSDLSA